MLRLVSSDLSQQHMVYINCYSADWEIYMALAKTFPNLVIGVTTNEAARLSEAQKADPFDTAGCGNR